LPTDHIRDVLRGITTTSVSSSESGVNKTNSFAANVSGVVSTLELTSTLLRSYYHSSAYAHSEHSALIHCSSYEAYRCLPPPLPTSHEGMFFLFSPLFTSLIFCFCFTSLSPRLSIA
jgi:hypothetical protein